MSVGKLSKGSLFIPAITPLTFSLSLSFAQVVKSVILSQLNSPPFIVALPLPYELTMIRLPAVPDLLMKVSLPEKVYLPSNSILSPGRKSVLFTFSKVAHALFILVPAFVSRLAQYAVGQ
jgi:hypothetical protein